MFEKCITNVTLIFQLAGFVNTRYCTLVNTSLIPMTFNLRVPADGWASEETHSRDNSLIDSNISDVSSTIMPSPREFDISPSTGTIAPQGELDIKVIASISHKFHVRCVFCWIVHNGWFSQVMQMQKCYFAVCCKN